MKEPITDYLKRLESKRIKRQQWKVGRELTYWKNRPQTIRYNGGLEILLEHDDSHSSLHTLDRVSITSSNGAYVANELAQQYIYLFDEGHEFEFAITSSHGSGRNELFVHYGSRSLMKSLRNLYTLLHELSHGILFNDKRYGSKSELEVACWDQADVLVKRMGLELFENEEERILYRDVHLRTYDPFNDDGVIRGGLMLEIDQNRYEREILGGLTAAALQGLQLKPLCQKLLEYSG